MIYKVTGCNWFNSSDHNVVMRKASTYVRTCSAKRALHIGTYITKLNRWMILLSLGGDSDGLYTWAERKDITELSALEQLADCLE